jgi:hypothetical protein
MDSSARGFGVRDDFTDEDLLVLTANLSPEEEAATEQQQDLDTVNECLFLEPSTSFIAQEVAAQGGLFPQSLFGSHVTEDSVLGSSIPNGSLSQAFPVPRRENTGMLPDFESAARNQGLSRRCFGLHNLKRVLYLWSSPPVFTSFWLLARMIGYSGTNPSEASQAIAAHNGWNPNESLLMRSDTFCKFTKERFFDIAMMLNIHHRRNMSASALLSTVLRALDGPNMPHEELLFSDANTWFTHNRERVEMLRQGATAVRRGFTEDAFIRPPFTAISWLAAHPTESQTPPGWTPRRLRSSRFRIIHGELVLASRDTHLERSREEPADEVHASADAHEPDLRRNSSTTSNPTDIESNEYRDSAQRNMTMARVPEQLSPPSIAARSNGYIELSPGRSRSDAASWMRDSYRGSGENIHALLSLVENISFDSREQNFITDRTFCKKLSTGFPESLEFSVPVPIDKMLPKMPNLRTAIVLRCFEVSNKRISSWSCTFPAACRVWLSLLSSPGVEMQNVYVKKLAAYVDLTLPIQKLYRKDAIQRAQDRTMSLRLDLTPCLGEDADSWPQEKFYVLVVQSAHLFSLQFELDRIISRRRPSLERAKAILCPASQTADDELGIESVRVSLLCPLSRTRIQIPVRVRGTTQLQCFDAASYIEMSRLTKKFVCPVTNKPAPLQALQICEFFRSALDFAHPNEEFIDVLPDGNFQHTADADTVSPFLTNNSFHAFHRRFPETKSKNEERSNRDSNSSREETEARLPHDDVVVVDLCD